MEDKKLSYRKIIGEIVKDGKWHPSWHFICQQTSLGWIGTSGDRRCRDMAVNGLLLRKIVEGTAMYHAA